MLGGNGNASIIKFATYIHINKKRRVIKNSIILNPFNYCLICDITIATSLPSTVNPLVLSNFIAKPIA